MLQPLVGIWCVFLQCVSVGLRLSFEQAECLHRHQQQQHPCAPSSSICASAPECKSLFILHSQRRAKKSGASIHVGGGDVSPYFISDSINCELLTFFLSNPFSTSSDFLLFCFFFGEGAINGFTLICASVSTVWLRGCFCCCCACKQRGGEKRERKDRKQ